MVVAGGQWYVLWGDIHFMVQIWLLQIMVVEAGPLVKFFPEPSGFALDILVH